MCLLDLRRIIVLCLPSLLFAAATTEPGKMERNFSVENWKRDYVKSFKF